MAAESARFLLGLDAGNTVIKAVLFDLEGRQVSACAIDGQSATPEPGHVERDLDELWRNASEALRRCISDAGVDPTQIVAAGCAGHGNGLYLLDRDDRPLIGIQSLDTPGGGTGRGARRRARGWPSCRIPPTAVAVTDPGAPVVDATPPSGDVGAGRHAPDVQGLHHVQADGPQGQRHLRHVRVRSAAHARVPLRRRPAGAVRAARSGPSAAVADRPDRDRRDGHRRGRRPDRSGGGHARRRRATSTSSRARWARASSQPGAASIIAGTWSINQYVSREPVVDRDLLMVSAFGSDRYMNMDNSATSASQLEWYVREFVERGGHHDDPFGFCHRRLADVVPRLDDPYFHPFLYGSSQGAEYRAGFYGLAGWHGEGHLLRALFEGVVFEHRRHVEVVRAAGAAFDAGHAVGRRRSQRVLGADARRLPRRTDQRRRGGGDRCARRRARRRRRCRRLRRLRGRRREHDSDPAGLRTERRSEGPLRPPLRRLSRTRRRRSRASGAA